MGRPTKEQHDAKHGDREFASCRWCKERGERAATPPVQRAFADAIDVETEDGRIVGFHPKFPVDLITWFHKNPRRGDLELIQESLEENGQYRTIVLNIGTHTGRPGECLAGNHTWRASVNAGRKTMPVNLVDVDEQRARKIVAVDNAANDKAKTDKDILADLLADLDDLVGSGITADEFAKMTGQDDDDPDTSPQLPDAEYAVIVNCRDEEHQAELLATFEDEGLDCRPLMM